MLGTITNTVAIIVGCSIGGLLKKVSHKNMK